MAFKVFYATLALLICATTISALDMIGNFNGKSYWIDQVSMSQEEAVIFCRRYTWDLVSLDSVAEADYVKSLVSNHTSNNGFWTSAKVTDTFKWANGEGFPLDLNTYPVVIDYRTCVAFWGPAMFAIPCEGLSGVEYFPMCQMRNARNVVDG